MTRDEELAAIAAHIAERGVSRPPPRGDSVLPLANVGEAKAWALRHGIGVRHHKGGTISIQNGPPVRAWRFVCLINGLRDRQLGRAVLSEVSRLPGERV